MPTIDELENLVGSSGLILSDSQPEQIMRAKHSHANVFVFIVVMCFLKINTKYNGTPFGIPLQRYNNFFEYEKFLLFLISSRNKRLLLFTSCTRRKRLILISLHSNDYFVGQIFLIACYFICK